MSSPRTPKPHWAKILLFFLLQVYTFNILSFCLVCPYIKHLLPPNTQFPIMFIFLFILVHKLVKLKHHTQKHYTKQQSKNITRKNEDEPSSA